MNYKIHSTIKSQKLLRECRLINRRYKRFAKTKVTVNSVVLYSLRFIA